MSKKRCRECSGFGYAQTYRGGRVQRVYCYCQAGEKRIREMKEAFEEMGMTLGTYALRRMKKNETWGSGSI